MFDLIDDLSGDVWEDKGSPPEDLTAISDYSDYVNSIIVSRKVEEGKTTYVVTDENGKNSKSLILNGTTTKDPLKNVRHFRAKVSNEGQQKERFFEIKAVLLDMDWVVKK